MTRIFFHPILGTLNNREKMTFQYNGEKYHAYKNETIAAALLANGIKKLRLHEETGTPRGIYCNIGHCMECRVTVNEQQNVRACLTIVENNMIISSGKQLPNRMKVREKNND